MREARATDGTQLLASMSSAGLVETENGNDAIEGDDESLDETVEDSEPPSPPSRPIRDLSLSERVALVSSHCKCRKSSRISIHTV